MFQKILVPLDGSPRAEYAIPVAARLAQASGGTVVLLRVAGLPTVFVPYPSADPWTIQKIIDADVEEAKGYLQSAASGDRLIDAHVETEVIVGTAATTIFSEAGRFDLIVLCSHGYTGMKRWLLGSVAEKVVHHAPIPVLLLREGGPALVSAHLQAEGPLRALIPLDGSARSQAVIVPAAQLIAALAAPGPATLHLTQVVALLETTKSGRGEREALMRGAEQYLSATVEHLREELVGGALADFKLAITWSITRDDDIAAGILRVAEAGEETEDVGVSGSFDLIAMATHGYSGIQRWAMGSITERVLHATRLPLLIVRPANMIDRSHQIQEPASVATLP